MSYVGTVLGGPRDGDVVECQFKEYVTVEWKANMVTFYAQVEIPTGPEDNYRYVRYYFKVDDDGRGWWVRPCQ